MADKELIQQLLDDLSQKWYNSITSDKRTKNLDEMLWTRDFLKPYALKVNINWIEYISNWGT